MRVTRPSVVKREKYLLCGTDRVVSTNKRQTYTRARTHAHTRSGAWLIPPNGGASVSRTVSHSSRQSFVSFQIYRPAPPSLSLSLSRTNICPLVLIRARKTNSPQPRISRFSTRNLARHSPSTRLDVARTRRGGSVVESRAIKTSGNIPPICGVSETQRSMRRSDTGKAFPLFNSSPLLLDFEKHSSILARCKRRLIYAGRASITFFPPSLPFPFPPFASLSRLPRSRRIRAVAGDDSTLLPFPGKRGR